MNKHTSVGSPSLVKGMGGNGDWVLFGFLILTTPAALGSTMNKHTSVAVCLARRIEGVSLLKDRADQILA